MPRWISPTASARTFPCSRRDDRRQIVHAILGDPQEPIENPDATQRRGICPFWERRASGNDGFADLIWPCKIDRT
jgi:hypothetical protein